MKVSFIFLVNILPRPLYEKLVKWYLKRLGKQFIKRLKEGK